MDSMRFFVSILFLCVAGCGGSSGSDVVAVENVGVLTMDTAAGPMLGQTVLIRGERILTVGPSAEVAIPRGATRIDGRGKWLLPGLTDMHAHPENAVMIQALTGAEVVADSAFGTEDVFLPYIAHGVTQVLSAGGTVETLEQREQIARGEALGPHLFVGAMVDGQPPIWPEAFSHPAAGPVEARARVRALLADGFDFIKTYSRLDQPTFEAIVDETTQAGGRVIGHLPGRGLDATEEYSGLELVMHAEEFAYQTPSVEQGMASLDRYIGFARRNGLGLVATLVVDQRILEQMRDPTSLSRRPDLALVNPLAYPFWFDHNTYTDASAERIAAVEEIARFNRRLVAAFAEAGIPVYAGTDTGIPGMVAGTSLHDEFVELVEAGMTPEQVLGAATRDASVWLGVGEDRGRILPGQRADLVLLNSDPLADIRNTRDIAAVILGGRVLMRAELADRLADLERRYAEMAGGR